MTKMYITMYRGCSPIRALKCHSVKFIFLFWIKILFLWFSVGLADGIIRTYDLFTAYDPGYFQLEILACDFAGHSTTTNVNIYILRDDQRVKIVFNEIPDLVRENQEDFINLLSNITGAIVNLDDIQVSLFYAFWYIFGVMELIQISVSFLSSFTWTRKAGWIMLRQICLSMLSTIRPTPS